MTNGRFRSLFLVLALLALPAGIQAQPWVVDDAGITDYGACQLETWGGGEEAWFLPACQLVTGFEVTTGVAVFDAGMGSRRGHAILEGKSTIWSRGVAELGLVGGVAVPFSTDGPRVAEAMAYLPLTLTSAGREAMLHLNAGAMMNRLLVTEDPQGVGEVERESAAIWGVRGDLPIHSRWTVIAEVFGMGSDEVETEAGLRMEVVPERLLVDVSYGHDLSNSTEGLGPQVALAWTPRPFSRWVP